MTRSRSRHRTYDQKTVERLDFLVRMRTSGMGISQLRRYVDLVRTGEATTPERLQIMLDQRERIVSQIHQLELALTTTDYKIAKYGGVPTDGNTADRISGDSITSASERTPTHAASTTHQPEGTSS